MFNKWTLGEDLLVKQFGIDPAEINDPKFDLLSHLGFTVLSSVARSHSISPNFTP